MRGWQLWTGIKNRADNPDKWEGTHIFVGDDGSVTRITDDNGVYDEFAIKRADE